MAGGVSIKRGSVYEPTVTRGTSGVRRNDATFGLGEEKQDWQDCEGRGWCFRAGGETDTHVAHDDVGQRDGQDLALQAEIRGGRKEGVRARKEREWERRAGVSATATAGTVASVLQAGATALASVFEPGA